MADVKQLDIGEGESAQSYMIKDAEARDLIDALQAENADLKEQIAELNSEIANLKITTANVQINSPITIDYSKYRMLLLISTRGGGTTSTGYNTLNAIIACDGWSGVYYFYGDSDMVSVTCSDKIAELVNNHDSFGCSLLEIMAN